MTDTIANDEYFLHRNNGPEGFSEDLAADGQPV